MSAVFVANKDLRLPSSRHVSSVRVPMGLDVADGYIARSASAGETPSRGVPGKGLAGHWQGSLKPTPVIELRLALEITNAPTGGAGGVMISVDQGGAPIPITALTEKSGIVHLETKPVSGVFDGKLSQDGSEIAGNWEQGARTMPLTFKRLAKALNLSRPQDPKKPYPYNEEEVIVERGYR